MNVISSNLSSDRVVDYDILKQASLRTDPFDYVVAPNFLTKSALEAANLDFPVLRTAGNYGIERLKFGYGFGRVIEALRSPEMTATVGEKFGLDLSESILKISIRGYCEESDGNIHADHWSKVITGLIYFNFDWPHEGGRLRMLRSSDDIEDFSEEVVPAGGTFLLFRRTDHSYHGHKPFVGERRILQASWNQTTLLARGSRSIGRFGTQIVKTISRAAQIGKA